MADWQRALVVATAPAGLTPSLPDAPTLNDSASTTAFAAASVEQQTFDVPIVVQNPYKGLRAFTEADAADFFGRTGLTRRLLEAYDERERQRRKLEQAQALAEERRRAAGRLRLRAYLLAGALVLASLAALAAGSFARSAQGSFRHAEGLRLATEASAALERGESGDLPALLALRSLGYERTPQGVEALRGALEAPFPALGFVGHTDAVQAVAFSPDGSQALTGSADTTARLWDARSGEQLRVFQGHTGAISDVAFSPDGKYALTGSADKTARLWDVTTGEQLQLFKGHFDEVWAVAFTPDGASVLTGSRDYTARLWNIATGEQQRLFPIGAAVYRLALSPDGRHMVSATRSDYSGALPKLWDVTTGKDEIVYFGHRGEMTDVVFGPDGTQVLTAASDQTARLWDAQSGAELRRFEGHTDGVESVAVTPDGTHLLTGSRDGTARLWELATGRQIRVYGGHAGAVLSVALSPDGRQLLTGGSDGTARLWETLATAEPLTLYGHRDAVESVAISPNGGRILTSSLDHSARLWDAASGQPLHELSGHVDLFSATFSPDGRYVVTGGIDVGSDAWRLWDVETGVLLRVIAMVGISARAAFTPDGRNFISAGYVTDEGGNNDSALSVFDVTTGSELRRIFLDPVNTLTLSPDGEILAVVPAVSADSTARNDLRVELYTMASGDLLRTLSGHTDTINSVAFSPDGKHMLTGAGPADLTARLWDTTTGEELRAFKGHGNSISSVAFSPDGGQVLTGSLDGTARLWDTATGEQLRHFSGHGGAVYAVAFAPDGKAVLTGGADKTAKLWHLDDADLVRIACVALTRDLTSEERSRFSITDTAATCHDS